MDIRALAYVVIDAVDPAQWRSFGSDVVGLQPVALPDGGVGLRMDERACRLFVQPAEADRYAASGWEVADKAAFAAALRALAQAGVEVTVATPAQARARFATEMAWFTDPAGNRHELIWGHRSDFARFASPAGVPRFVTGALGLGHTVLPAPAFDRTLAFMSEVMGFASADILTHHGPDGGAQRIHFLHCNNGRHHSLALFEGAVPAGCVHLMVEVESMDEVGRAMDRVRQAEVPLMATLGRHVNDAVTSFYFRSPAGFAIEFGYGGRVIDWATHTVFESTAVSLWGHDFSLGF